MKGSTHIKLGPYILEGSLGRGGMAEVWRGIHGQHGYAVAVKVISTRKARDQRHRDAFYHEIRAVAGLSHPHILPVLDYGEVDEAAADQNSHLVTGSPWLVMELADGGNLTPRCGVIPWREGRHILLSLLDALAHAHARGVTHLDIKPDNVLFTATGDLPGLRLADFGIALAFDEVQPQEAPDLPLLPGDGVVGTPAYMAPELFLGDWRDVGAWSDLYALGCLAWQLVTGRTPFAGLNLPQQIQAQCYDQPGAFEPRMPVPRGLEVWLRTLLHKEPRRRFRRAADAAWALLHLLEEEGVHPPSTKDAPTLEESATEVGLARTHREAEEIEDTGEMLATMTLRISPQEAQAAITRCPPCPPTWRHREHTWSGKMWECPSLFNLRRHPLIGRERERDLLWSLLREVHTSGSVRVALVRGAPGTGKSRLASWLGERAHELGAATPLAAYHDREGSAMQGILAMLGRHLRCVGLNPPQLRQRVENVLKEWGVTDPYDWKTLSDLFISHLSGGNEVTSNLNPSEVVSRSVEQDFALYRRIFRRLATFRPLIVWLDNVQWAPESLAWVRSLVEEGGAGADIPLLLVLTQPQTNSPAGEAAEANLLADLHGHPRVRVIDLEEQVALEHRNLVLGLLGLASPLVDQVVERTQGNPLFVVQLVGDWVSRGILVPGPAGLELAEGAEITLPDNLHQMWLERIGQILTHRPLSWQLSLALMGLLGDHVHMDEWRHACTRAGLPSDPALLEVLEHQGLLERERPHSPGIWKFVHTMFRESLERVAKEGSLFCTWHLACAQMLGERNPVVTLSVAKRITLHLEQAGAYEQAAISARGLIRTALSAGNISLAHHWLEQIRGWTSSGKLPLSPRDTLQLRLVEVDILKANRHFEAFIQAAEHVVADIDKQADPLLLMESRGVLARMWTLKGDFERAGAAFAEGYFLAEQLGQLPIQAQYLQGIAEARMGQGHYDDALEYCQQAYHLIKGQGYPLIEFESASRVFDFALALGRLQEGHITLGVMAHLAELLDNERYRSLTRRAEGILAMKLRQYQVAEKALRTSLEGFRRLGDVRGEGDVALDLAELLRKQGKAAEAEPLARLGYAIRTRSQGPDVDGSTPYNLAIVLVMCGKGDEAAKLLNESLEKFNIHGQVGLLAAYHLLLALVSAQGQLWWLVDIHLAAVEQHLPELAMPDPDDIWVATRLGQWALQNKEYGRAEIALRYAVDFSTRLGKTDEKLRAEQLLQGLPA